jgi:4,4-dimethyl-9beta,19-cyclopropylsterol-4alpha-methyl oxidase
MIPFASLPEAEEALGRSLTLWEELWWSKTHNVSDYTLYCMNIIFLFVIFSVVPLPYVLLDVLKVKSAEKYKVQAGVHNEPSATWRCYKVVMWTFFTVVGPLQLCSFPAVRLIGVRFGLPLPAVSEVLMQLTVYTMVEDFGNYWLHRWLHNGWWYDAIHSVHHEFSAPMSFAAPYAHWAEVVILGVPTFAGPAMAPGHIITFWLWIAMRQLEALETHSGYDFPWNPTRLIPFYGGAEYHDYHHFVGAKCSSNFASVFTYCDWLYGTDKGYRYMKEVHRKEAIAKSKEQEKREAGWLRADDLKPIPSFLSKDIKSS